MYIMIKITNILHIIIIIFTISNIYTWSSLKDRFESLKKKYESLIYKNIDLKLIY